MHVFILSLVCLLSLPALGQPIAKSDPNPLTSDVEQVGPGGELVGSAELEIMAKARELMAIPLEQADLAKLRLMIDEVANEIPAHMGHLQELKQDASKIRQTAMNHPALQPLIEQKKAIEQKIAEAIAALPELTDAEKAAELAHRQMLDLMQLRVQLTQHLDRASRLQQSTGTPSKDDQSEELKKELNP